MVLGQTTATPDKSSERWVVLAVLFTARTAMAFQFQTIGSLSIPLIDTFGIDFVMVGTLIGIYLAPGIFFALPSGVLGQRFGARNAVLAGLLLMLGGGLLTCTNSLWLVFAGRAISGIGAVLINVLMSKMVADWFDGRQTVVAMSVFIMSWPLGLALCLVSLPLLAEVLSWNTAMLTGAAFTAISLALVWRYYREPPGLEAREPAVFRILLNRREWVLTSLSGFVWCTYNVGFVVLISFLPQFFVTRGYSLIEASSIVSLLGWILIGTVPLGGMIYERLKLPNAIMIGSFLIVAAAAVALPYAGDPVPAFAVIAIVIGIPAGLIMALPAQSVSAQNRSAGMGVFYTVYYAGMSALPAMAGGAQDITGNPGAPALFAAAMLALAIATLGLFRLLQRRLSPSA